VRTFNNFLGNL